MTTLRDSRGRTLFTLGFNFDDELLDGLVKLNESYSDRRIQEVFGALPDSPISSARPTSRLPVVGWPQFARQVARLADNGIAFNYLLNTNQAVSSKLRPAVTSYLQRLHEAGVLRVTAGSPQIAELIKVTTPETHVTMSITRGVRSARQIREASDAGCDATYLDAVFVNRNFALLRSLLRASSLEYRLYANVSCVSACPVVRQHYDLFAGPQTEETTRRSDAFFAGCTLTKLRSPLEWLQMPWIRPEDIGAYVAEGISWFKLADRLAPTPVLLRIANSYLSGVSPPDLFEIIERDGIKYRKSIAGAGDREHPPLTIRSDRIPVDFIDHFRYEGCRSHDENCAVCTEIALNVIEVATDWQGADIDTALVTLVPRALLRRAEPAVTRTDR